jgi:hypothetical protein
MSEHEVIQMGMHQNSMNRSTSNFGILKYSRVSLPLVCKHPTTHSVSLTKSSDNLKLNMIARDFDVIVMGATG